MLTRNRVTFLATAFIITAGIATAQAGISHAGANHAIQASIPMAAGIHDTAAIAAPGAISIPSHGDIHRDIRAHHIAGAIHPIAVTRMISGMIDGNIAFDIIAGKKAMDAHHRIPSANHAEQIISNIISR